MRKRLPQAESATLTTSQFCWYCDFQLLTIPGQPWLRGFAAKHPAISVSGQRLRVEVLRRVEQTSLGWRGPQVSLRILLSRFAVECL